LDLQGKQQKHANQQGGSGAEPPAGIPLWHLTSRVLRVAAESNHPLARRETARKHRERGGQTENKPRRPWRECTRDESLLAGPPELGLDVRKRAVAPGPLECVPPSRENTREETKFGPEAPPNFTRGL
jgi:hypothetical protein